MNSHEQDREARLQAAAEKAERLGLPSGSDPELDRQRLVIRALRQQPEPQLSANFARAMAVLVARREQKSAPEDWMMTVLMGVLGVGSLVYVMPIMGKVMGEMHVSLPRLPWPMVIATVIAIGAAWAVDQGLLRVESKRR
jgi:hypothetical protein